MNTWLRLALFSLIGIVVLNLFMNVFFGPVGYRSNYYGGYNGGRTPVYRQMNGGMMNR